MRQILLIASLIVITSKVFGQSQNTLALSPKELHQWIAQNIMYPDEQLDQKGLSSIILLRLHKTKLEADTLEVFSWAEPILIAEAKRLCKQFNTNGIRANVPDKTVIPMLFIHSGANGNFDPTALKSWSRQAGETQEGLMTTLQPVVVTISQPRK